jgi:hypothetical protein
MNRNPNTKDQTQKPGPETQIQRTKHRGPGPKARERVQQRYAVKESTLRFGWCLHKSRKHQVNTLGRPTTACMHQTTRIRALATHQVNTLGLLATLQANPVLLLYINCSTIMTLLACDAVGTRCCGHSVTNTMLGHWPPGCDGQVGIAAGGVGAGGDGDGGAGGIGPLQASAEVGEQPACRSHWSRTSQ